MIRELTYQETRLVSGAAADNIFLDTNENFVKATGSAQHGNLGGVNGGNGAANLHFHTPNGPEINPPLP